MDNFITISNNIENEITVKKSKFICNLIKIETQQEAEEQIKIIKKKYYDARHNCVAYRVQENDGIFEKADRKSTRLNSSHPLSSRMPSSA